MLLYQQTTTTISDYTRIILPSCDSTQSKLKIHEILTYIQRFPKPSRLQMQVLSPYLGWCSFYLFNKQRVLVISEIVILKKIVISRHDMGLVGRKRRQKGYHTELAPPGGCGKSRFPTFRRQMGVYNTTETSNTQKEHYLITAER